MTIARNLVWVGERGGKLEPVSTFVLGGRTRRKVDGAPVLRRMVGVRRISIVDDVARVTFVGVHRVEGMLAIMPGVRHPFYVLRLSDDVNILNKVISLVFLLKSTHTPDVHNGVLLAPAACQHRHACAIPNGGPCIPQRVAAYGFMRLSNRSREYK